MVTRAEMSVRTKASLIRVATTLLAERSYDDTSVDDIATAAGVTKGAFYHHYSGKEELVLALQEHLLDEAIDRSAAIVAQRMAPPDELRALVRLHVSAVVEHRRALSVSLPERRSAGPEKWAVIRAKRDRIEAFVVECIERGARTGHFGDGGDARLRAYGLLGMCYWSNAWYRPGGRWSVDQVVDTFADLALTGLAR
jgi:TetR/AcrR family transcriptional regulator, cholesterol catabolism regulator